MSRLVEHELDLSSKSVIVTGAGTGMGREMSLEFASRGASVVLSSNVESEIAGVAAECDPLPGRAVAVPADVSSDDDVAHLVEAAVDRFGAVDALVNNAGIISAGESTTRRPLSKTSMREWNRVLDVNLGGTARGIKAVTPVMTDAGGGSIITLSSGTARDPLPGLAPYTTSKFAIEGLTRIVALELAEAGIRVNAIQPGGPVDTGMMPADMAPETRAKLHQPSVIRKCAAWLVSDKSSLVTGQSFVAYEWNRARGIVACPCPRCTSTELNAGDAGWTSSAR